MLMVPIYALSSLISLFSLDAAFFIDVIRDVYEVCTVYTRVFFLVKLEHRSRLSSFIASSFFCSIIWAASVRFSFNSTDDHLSQPYFLSVFGDTKWMLAIHTRFSSLNEAFCVSNCRLFNGHADMFPLIEYVQVKPVLAVASLIMKATGTYHEGDFRARSGYLYVSIVYNVSICLALYCLAVFWMCVSGDLKPFRWVNRRLLGCLKFNVPIFQPCTKIPLC
jgi:hypothetical protein